ncbi:MAG: hypothetical protein HZA50_12985 [Planctomycetes bacterium]|nr:hypothetical protein [Planctomycetota bacterium]
MGKKKDTMGLFEAIARAQQKKQTTGIAIPAWMQKKGLVPKNHVQPAETPSAANGQTATLEPPATQTAEPVQPATRQQPSGFAKAVPDKPQAKPEESPTPKPLELRQQMQRQQKPLLPDHVPQESPGRPAQKEPAARQASGSAELKPQTPSALPEMPQPPAGPSAHKTAQPAATKIEQPFLRPDRDMLRPKVAAQPAIRIMGGRIHLSVSGGVCLIAAASALLVLAIVFMLGWVWGGRGGKDSGQPQPRQDPIAGPKKPDKPGHPQPVPVNRIAGKHYLVIQILEGDTENDMAEAQKIIDFLKQKGEPAGVITLTSKRPPYKSRHTVLSNTAFDSSQSAQADEFRKKIESLGKDYLAKSRLYGFNSPFYLQWVEQGNQ